MAETPEQVADILRAQIEPGTRDKLVAKGLARSMIWANGVLPDGAPRFKSDLSADLLDHGFSVLSRACRLKDLGGDTKIVEDSFRVAAEAIEAAVRRGEVSDSARAFYLVAAAAAFHIAHFSARAYSLLEGTIAELNLSTGERALVSLMRRDFGGLRTACFAWRNDPDHSDDTIAAQLQDAPDYLPEEVVAMALTSNFLAAMSRFDFAVSTGAIEEFENVVARLHEGAASAAEFRLVPAWWLHTLARHLVVELFDLSLHQRLPILSPEGEGEKWNALRAAYIRALASRPLGEIDLWPSQLEAAARAVEPFDDLVVALPTSAGKTRIAELCILRCLAAGRRTIYVTPLRALSAQVERTLARTFRPLGVTVTSLYGASGVAVADIDALARNQIVVATPEKLDFAIRQQPNLINDVGLVVLDEGHMIGLGTREVRYEVLIQRLLKRSDATTRRLVCLSAVFRAGGTFSSFVEWLRSDEPGAPISSSWRPTRQRPGLVSWNNAGYARLTLLVDGEQPFIPRFITAKKPVKPRRTDFPRAPAEFVIACADAFAEQGHAVLIYCPTRRSVESQAKLLLKVQQQQMVENRLRDASQIERAAVIGAEWLGRGHVAVQSLLAGVAVHHGGLPRQFLAEIETLLNLKRDNPLPITIASPTLAQGIDLSCSALVFQSLYRSGKRIPAQEYSNVIGRAGRAFVDIDGISVFPIFESGEKFQKRLRDYNELRREAQTREMESGIILLIEEIAKRLAEALGIHPDGLLEYVLNHGGSFGPIIEQALDLEKAPPSGDGDGADEDEREEGVPLSLLVDDLDTAILSTIDDLNCPIDKLADALDEALRSSLWSRRLAVRPLTEPRIQFGILRDRAGWIWSRSTSDQRRGFFAAGVGFEGGAFLAATISELVPDLLAAEIAFDDGRPEDAIEPLCNIIERMLEIPPFKIKKVPANWKDLVAGWITGVPLGSLISDADLKAFEFIQDGLVYSMVWAVEAIRVFGVAVGSLTGDELGGRSALALTYGAPSIYAALLLQAGLPSRVMAVLIDGRYPTSNATIGRFARWLNEVIRTLEPTDHWQAPHQRIWESFVVEWGKAGIAEWESLELTFPLPAEAATDYDGQSVRLLAGAHEQELVIADLDLRKIIELTDPRASNLQRYGHGRIVGAEVNIDYFGPPLG